MQKHAPLWLEPRSLEEALELRERYAEDATVIAGGTFVGILMAQRVLMPSALMTLRHLHTLAFIEHDAERLRLGAMTTHRAVERSTVIQQAYPSVAYTFSLVASPRIRNQATVGGVLADADYASDPPALLHALNAQVIALSSSGEREIAVADLITGYYETTLRPDELLLEVRIPRLSGHAVYRKFRSRSSEDRPCVTVAAARVEGKLRIVVGAVAEKPQYFPAICALADGETLHREVAAEIGNGYAAAIDAITDSRGTGTYRKRVIAVEVRRALEELEI